MSLNHRQVLEALLAGETLRDTQNPDVIRYLQDDILVSAKSTPTSNLYLDDWEIKPKTIHINGYEVPEPVREPLLNGTRYCLADTCSHIREYTWRDQEVDFDWLKAGLIHLTKEAAELHRKALVSFTEKSDD